MSDMEADLTAKLQDMVWKIDNEGLDYFLENYIDMVPDECPAGYSISLLTFAREARLALETFERHAREICDANEIEYDQ